MDKTYLGPVLVLFSVQLQKLFCLHWRYPLVTNHFSLLLIDKYTLVTQQIRSISNTLFDLQQSSELSQRPWNHGYNSESS